MAKAKKQKLLGSRGDRPSGLMRPQLWLNCSVICLLIAGGIAGFPGGILLQGAVPVMHQNECVGAIGVSGVRSHEDEQIAQAGANALG